MTTHNPPALTVQEMTFILRIIDLAFQSGGIRGTVDFMEESVGLARSVEAKFQAVNALMNEQPSSGEKRRNATWDE